MKIASLILLAACATVLNAQNGGTPILSESRSSYNAIKNNLIAMAEKMPAESYDFKPVPEVRSFGELMAHIADSQTRLCSVINGQAKTPNAASKTTREDLVAALKSAFGECDAAWDATNESNAGQMMPFRGGQQSRASMLIFISIIHNNEEYGYGSMYLRLKHIVPPSSDRSGAPAGKKK